MQITKRYLSLILVITFFICNLVIPEMIAKGEEIEDSTNQIQTLRTDSINVLFESSTEQTMTKTIALPEWSSISSVSVDTGDVSYIQNKNNITLTVTDGIPTGTFTPSKFVTGITQYGATPSSINFSSGGYSGVLDLDRVDFEYYELIELRTFDRTENGAIYSYYNSNGSMYDSQQYNLPQNIYINEDGYSGYIQKINMSLSSPTYHYNQDGSYVKVVQVISYFSGVLSKTTYVPEPIGYYSGYIYGQVVDTYSYNVTISFNEFKRLEMNALNDSNDITLTWDELKDVTAYEIKADGIIHTVQDNLYFKHTGLLPETTHVYQIRPVNAEITGDWSEELVVETKKAPPTVVPANLTLQASSSTVTATWDEIPNGGVVYQIQIDGKIIDTGFENTYTHKNLSLYSRHTYRVRAVNSSGAGEWSQAKSIITKFLPPIAPTLKAVGSKDKIVITWEEVLDVSNYIIEAKCSDPNIEGITIDNKKNTYRIIYGEPNTTYYIKVKAKNSAGESAWSEIQVKTYTLETPEFEAIEESQTEAHLTWTSIEGATGYEVECDGVLVGTALTTEFQDTGLTVETSYSYRIRATGENSTDSNWSYVVEVITLPEKPPVPEKFYATGANEMVTLSWQPVTEASAYDLEIDGVIIENGNKTVYTFRDIQPKTEHFYRVRSRNTGIEGDWHEGITLITLPDAISPPKDIHVATTNTITKIAWEKVPDAIRYEVEVDGVIVYSGTRTEFIHRRLALNEEHIYKIRSKGHVETSKWSEEIVNNAVTLVCDKAKDAKIGLTASEVTDFEGYTLTVVYNPDVLEVKDLCTFSDEIELQAGTIEGTDIIITHFEPGKIEFKINKAIELGKSWSGIINSIKFEGKLTGGTTITYTVFIEEKVQE